MKIYVHRCWCVEKRGLVAEDVWGMGVGGGVKVVAGMIDKLFKML